MSDDINDLQNYHEFIEGESHNVTLADESVVPAAGQGDLNMHLTDIHGKKIPVVFKNVMFVPTLKKKLISIGQLTQRGAEVVFRRNSVGLSIGNTKFSFGCRVGKMFKLKGSASCCFTSIDVSKISSGNSPHFLHFYLFRHRRHTSYLSLISLMRCVEKKLSCGEISDFYV